MNRAFGIILLCVVMGLSAFGQEPVKPKHLAEPSSQNDNAPVTRAEARTVVMKMQHLLALGISLSTPAAKIEIPVSSAPVTRPEVIREFSRMFADYEKAFKFTPPKVKFDASEITLKDAAEKPALEKLIAWGAIAKLGPLASGATATLTVHQFGDAVGFYMARIAALAYVPPSKWTPYLNGGRS